jgi:hypothetical protein
MPKFLSEVEEEKLVMSLANGQSKFTEKDAHSVLKGAENVRIENALLETLLEGKVVV